MYVTDNYTKGLTFNLKNFLNGLSQNCLTFRFKVSHLLSNSLDRKMLTISLKFKK
jgi:hypothetical protein